MSEQVEKCHCCYICIKSHSVEGCDKCHSFLDAFLPSKKIKKLKKSTDKEVDSALSDLFSVMNLSHLKVENRLSLSKYSFVKDLKRKIDEIKCPNDIVDFWHVPMQVAVNIFAVLQEVIFDDQNAPMSYFEGGNADSSTESEDDCDSDSD